MTPTPNGKLWEAIRQAGFSQRDFARVVKAHEGTVSRVVCGRFILDQSTQLRWAKVLRRRPEDLFGDGKGCAA
jgi:transcriptional regulator with XRE-family HTH domain